MNNITLSIEIDGVNREIVLMTPCGKCNATGRIMRNAGRDYAKCMLCNGSGFKFTSVGKSIYELGRVLAADRPSSPQDVARLAAKLNRIRV